MKIKNAVITLVIAFGLPCFAGSLHAAEKKISVNVISELFQHVLDDGLTPEGKAEIKDGPAKEYIKVKQMDLNGDGTPEYMVEGLRAPLAGMMAGNVWIYENKIGKYVLIGDLGSFEDVMPLKSKHNGYRDIQVAISLNAGQRKEKSKFIFDGSKYELKK